MLFERVGLAGHQVVKSGSRHALPFAAGILECLIAHGHERCDIVERYADRAGIHRTYVSDIERGRRNPTVTVVERLAKPLGVRPGDLLD